MSELVPRNSELVGYVQENEYELAYQKNKGLAISGRHHEVVQQPMSRLDKLKYKYNPETKLFRNGLLGNFALEVVNATVYDIPDGAHNWMIAGIATAVAVQYANNAEKRGKRNNAKNTPITLEVASNQPETMYIPSSEARFELAADEQIADNLLIIDTYDGRKLLDAMDVEVDDELGMLEIKHDLSMQLSKKRQQLDNLYIESSDDATQLRAILKADIKMLSHWISNLEYGHITGKYFIENINKTVSFDAAKVLYTILQGSVNKGQLISDTQRELGTIVALMEERIKLQNALNEIPYADKDLHGKLLATIRANQKQLDLQILSELISIKKIALTQQAELLELYADGAV